MTIKTKRQKLKTFRIWVKTIYGIGCFELKSKSMNDLKLTKKDKLNLIQISEIDEQTGNENEPTEFIF